MAQNTTAPVETIKPCLQCQEYAKYNRCWGWHKTHTYDLGQAVQIASVRGATVAGPTEQKGAAYSWTLQTGVDTVTWTNAGTISATGAEKKPFGPVSVNRSARYIRIFSNSTGFVDWSEITVSSTAAAPQAASTASPAAATPAPQQSSPSAAGTSVPAPKNVDLTHYKGSKAVVKFDHANHGAQQIACATCHHKPKDGKAYVRCSDCHQREAVDTIPAFKDAFHQRCKGCHVTKNDPRAPVQCAKCHK